MRLDSEDSCQSLPAAGLNKILEQQPVSDFTDFRAGFVTS